MEEPLAKNNDAGERKIDPFRRRGEPWVWVAGGALALVLATMTALGVVVLVNALPVLLPPSLAEVVTVDGECFLGAPRGGDVSPGDGGGPRRQYKVANRELNGGVDFRWLPVDRILRVAWPEDAVRVERFTGGDFHGRLLALDGESGESAPATAARLRAALAAFGERRARGETPLAERLSARSERLRTLRLEILTEDYRAGKAPEEADGARARAENLRAEAERLQAESDRDARALADTRRTHRDAAARFATADGREIRIPLAEIVRVDWPNRWTFRDRLAYAGWKAKSLFLDPPREANTEGGLLPALFGTVLLVMLMAATAFPLGVTAGVYLREYARDNAFTRLVRVAVNNLAGVPSIVYGIFGLGFFVHGVGGGIDRFFFPERVAAGITTFGTGGVLWAGLTLGLLTLPVVIVATEEALASVPRDLRQGALALGATSWQALARVTLPTASPGILTGFILAMARAAGEVAPLMLTGVVKSSSALAVDGTWPFVHLERKFMHLGFHLYDVGFQSPNVEAARPMVYATALLLLLLVFALNLAAIRLRNALRRKYRVQAL